MVAISPPLLLGALAVQMRADLDFSPAQLGIAAASFRAVVVLSSATLGRLVDVAGPSRTMRAAAMVTAVAALAIALFADSWPVLLFLLILGGIGGSLHGPATNAFLSRAVRVGRRGLAFGVQQSAPPATALLGGFAVPLVALTVGWRWVFGGAAVLAVIAALVVPAARPLPPTPPAAKVRSTRLRAAVLVGVAMAFGFGAATTMSTFLVEAAVDAGVGEGMAGLLLAGGASSSIVVRLITGRRSDRWTHGHLRVAALMLAAGGVGYLGLATGIPTVMLGGTIVAFGLGWGFSAIVFFALGRMYPDNPGTAAGVVLTGGAVGGIVTPVVFGYAIEAASFGVAWSLLAAWTAVAAMLLSVARREHNRTLDATDGRRV